jgi:Tfp pilus assembly protein PilF
MRQLLSVLLLLSFAFPPLLADAKKAADKVKKAEVDLDRRNLPGAEKNARSAIQEDPNNIEAHALLADILAATGRNSQAAPEYERVLQLDDEQHKYRDAQRRKFVDQYGVTTALGGNLQKAKQIYLDAIAKDPDYAMFNYNLACVYAELGDLESALPYLKKSWEHRDTLPSDIKYPDPRKDNSFRQYLNDPRFQEAVKYIVL